MFTAPSTVFMLVPFGQPPEPTYFRPSACACSRRASHVPVSTAPWSATACRPWLSNSCRYSAALQPNVPLKFSNDW